MQHNFLTIPIYDQTAYLIEPSALSFKHNDQYIWTDKKAIRTFLTKVSLTKDSRIYLVNSEPKVLAFLRSLIYDFSVLDDVPTSSRIITINYPLAQTKENYWLTNNKLASLKQAQLAYQLTIDQAMTYQNFQRVNLPDQRFYLYKLNQITPTKAYIFYHGSRDLAWSIALSGTLPSDGLIVLGQADLTNLQEPTFHSVCYNITFGEIYWEIRDFLPAFVKDIQYTCQLVEDLRSKFKIGSIYHIGHSNGGVFNLQLALHTPELFNGIISNMGGLGFDPLYQLNLELPLTRRTPILLVSGEYDEHLEPCRSAQALLSNNDFCAQLIVIPNMTHCFSEASLKIILDWIDHLEQSP